MHKGRFYRSIVPYMASKNWLFDSKPPMRVFFGTLFNYSGAPLDLFPFVKSDPAVRDLATLEFEWRGEFSIGFFDFRFFVNIRPELTTPNNLISLLLIDSFASTLLAEWVATPDKYWWASGLHITEEPRTKVVTGFFGEQPLILNLDIVSYHQE